MAAEWAAKARELNAGSPLRKVRPLMLRVLMACLVTVPVTTVHALQADPSPDQDIREEPNPPPDLYVTVDEASIYLIQEDRQLDVGVGEAAHATGTDMQALDETPDFLNWPCTGAGSGELEILGSYAFESLPVRDRIGQVAKRFFEDQLVLGPPKTWLNGDYHGSVEMSEIERYVSYANWYSTGPSLPGLAEKRPRVLLIGLFYGTAQIVVDTNHLDSLKAHYGDNEIPVFFEFHDENTVPVSYFGRNPAIQTVQSAYLESGVILAPAPLWFAGDRQLETTPDALSRLLNLASSDQLDTERLETLKDSLRADGFAAKPITLFLVSDGETILADDPDRIIAASALQMDSVPIMFSYAEAASPTRRCGLTVMIEAAGGLGQSNGSTSPPSSPGTGLPDIPATEPPVSGG